jgi:ribosomal protein L11 methyltransferase
MAAVYRTFPVGRAAGQTISEGRIIRTCLTAGRFVICGAMQYRELRIEVAAPYAEPLSELLGERLLPFQECDQGTLDAPPVGRTRFHLYLDDSQVPAVPDLLTAVHELVTDGTSVVIEQRERDDSEWRDVWKQYFATRRIGRIAIVPSWEAADHQPEPGEITLHLDPGRAFGTGGHASTRLCLLLLDKLAEYEATREAREWLGKDFVKGDKAAILDVGCGCGVLALAALLLWPQARALAIDIDPEAIEVTDENTARNQLTERLRSSTKRLQRFKESVALQFGNLTGPTLHLLCDDMVRHLRPGGVLIASGILTVEADGVIEAFVQRGLVLVSHLQEEEWSGILMYRPTDGMKQP